MKLLFVLFVLAFCQVSFASAVASDSRECVSVVRGSPSGNARISLRVNKSMFAEGSAYSGKLTVAVSGLNEKDLNVKGEATWINNESNNGYTTIVFPQKGGRRLYLEFVDYFGRQGAAAILYEINGELEETRYVTTISCAPSK